MQSSPGPLRGAYSDGRARRALVQIVAEQDRRISELEATLPPKRGVLSYQMRRSAVDKSLHLVDNETFTSISLVVYGELGKHGPRASLPRTGRKSP